MECVYGKGACGGVCVLCLGCVCSGCMCVRFRVCTEIQNKLDLLDRMFTVITWKVFVFHNFSMLSSKTS
jgi:hypothetical protein